MPVKCEVCESIFYPKSWHVKIGWGRFCSNKCHFQSMRTGRLVSCHQCGVRVYKNQTQLNRSKSGKFFCSKSCQTIWRNKYFSRERHSLWKFGEHIYRNLMKQQSKVQICKRCHIRDTRVLVVHHIDKNRKNNDLKNLVWLCHNCHFVIHNDTLEEQKLMVAMV